VASSVLCLGIAACLCCPGITRAQSAQFYGDVDLSIVRLQGVAVGERRWRMQGADSLIGLRVREGWGEHGFEVRLEHGWNAATGASADAEPRPFGRQSWIGWRSPFGEARFGRQESPLFEVMRRLDPLQARGMGSTLRLASAHPERFDDLASWRSGGSAWHLTLAFAPGEQAQPNHGRNRYAAAVGFEREPWYAGFAHVQQNSADALHKTRASLVGVTRDLGGGRLYFAYYRGDDRGARIDDSVDGKYYSLWSLGTEHTAGPRWRVAAALGLAYDTGPTREHAYQLTMRTSQALSTRAELYALATWLRQPRGPRLSLVGGSGAEPAQSGWQVGLRYRL
jgi:predicted porin